MDDVVAEVVLARGDEDLGPADGVAAVGIGLGLGLDQPEVGAAMRLGQVHRPGPGSRDHLGDVFRLLLVRALDQQRGDRRRGQAMVHFERLVGRQDIFADRGREHLRQALPAIFLGRRQGRPAALAELPVGLLEPGRGGDAAVGVARAAFEVADAVQGREHFGREPPAFAEDGLDDVGRRVGEGREIVIFAKLDDVIEHEPGVADGGGVDGHRVSLPGSAR